MRTVGRRTDPPLQTVASAAALRRGLAIVDAAAGFGWAASTGQRKGVYRFASFEAMEQHRVECLAQAMAERDHRINTAPHE
jgi:predicted methyltransferase